MVALSARATNSVERSSIVCLLIAVYSTPDEASRAVAVGLEYLRELEIEWSPHPTAAEVRREQDGISSQLGVRGIEELVDLPLMRDAASLATLDVLTMSRCLIVSVCLSLELDQVADQRGRGAPLQV